jgi:hypothetical protein
MKKFLLLATVLVLAGCGDNFRYPCQNPLNWDKDKCKPPLCTAKGTCPDDLQPLDKIKSGEVKPPSTTTGACK